jgi:ABC-type antimicrobial peptide transport system permease subunit
MIGLALVTLVATLAAGLIKPFESAVDKIFTADYAVTPSNNLGGGTLPIAAVDAIRRTPGVEAAAGVRLGEAKIFDKSVTLTAIDPDADKVLTLKWKAGDQSLLGGLAADGAIVEEQYATNHDLRLGSSLTMTVATGATVPLRVQGIFTPPDGGSPLGPVTISSATFDRTAQQPADMFGFAKIAGGVTAANTAALTEALKPFPNAKIQTRKQFKDGQIAGIKGILNVLYVLLALSVLVSIFGIVNTLVLTVFERTRELGMIRAIGMTRRQTRRMIRHESVVIALIGAILGIVLGLVFAALLIARVDMLSWALPVGQLVTFAMVSVLVGIFAAIFPARRAARLNPLEALKYE